MFCIVECSCFTLCLRVSHCVLWCWILVFHFVFCAVAFLCFTLCFCCWILVFPFVFCAAAFLCFTSCFVLLDSCVSLCVFAAGFLCFPLYFVLLDSLCFTLCFVLFDIPASVVTFQPLCRRQGPTTAWPDSRWPMCHTVHSTVSLLRQSAAWLWWSALQTAPLNWTAQLWPCFPPESLSIGTAQHIVAVQGELFTESARYVVVFGDLPGTLHRSRCVYHVWAGECCSYSLTSSQCCRVDHRNACLHCVVWTFTTIGTLMNSKRNLVPRTYDNK